MLRRDCYQNAMMEKLASRALREYDEFIAAEPKPLLGDLGKPR
jgi:hypothetical protein